MSSDAVAILGLGVLVCGLLVAPSQARAGIIYDNGGPDLVSGLFSDVSQDDARVADDFSFTGLPHEVNDIHWFGGYCDFNPDTVTCTSDDAPAADNFTIRIHADDGGVPDTNDFIEVYTGAAMRMDTGLDDDFGIDIYEYWVDIDPVILDDDTDFWLEIFNDAVAGGGDPWSWSTSDTSGGGNAASTIGEGNDWKRM